MKDLAIKRELNEETRKQGIIYPNGEVYSLHITNNGEVIITDFSDYTKIYCVYSLDFYNAVEWGRKYDLFE